MKSKIEKINETSERIVFRLDLISETEQDKKALSDLTLESIQVTDQMIQSIIEEKAVLLRDEHKPDWNYDWEKKHGDIHFYINLKKPTQDL